MLLLTYPEQLKILASEEHVDLLDAVRHAGINEATYYRSIRSDKETLQYRTAAAIAQAIKDLGVR